MTLGSRYGSWACASEMLASTATTPWLFLRSGWVSPNARSERWSRVSPLFTSESGSMPCGCWTHSNPLRAFWSPRKVSWTEPETCTTPAVSGRRDDGLSETSPLRRRRRLRIVAVLILRRLSRRRRNGRSRITIRRGGARWRIRGSGPRLRRGRRSRGTRISRACHHGRILVRQVQGTLLTAARDQPTRTDNKNPTRLFHTYIGLRSRKASQPRATR